MNIGVERVNNLVLSILTFADRFVSTICYVFSLNVADFQYMITNSDILTITGINGYFYYFATPNLGFIGVIISKIFDILLLPIKLFGFEPHDTPLLIALLVTLLWYVFIVGLIRLIRLLINE